MLSVEIEKEIKKENKILRGLTMRQTICVTLALLLIGGLCIITKIFFTKLWLPISCIAFFFGVLGWWGKDGLHAEDFFLRFVRKLALKNGRLKYRTKNEYVKLYNDGFMQERNIKANDKEYQKNLKKEKKQNKKDLKNSKLKAYT